jgi:uncharacterized protein (TIGR00255 family)
VELLKDGASGPGASAPRSMTGSGRATAHTEGGVVTFELRSVNGRSLHLKTRLPVELQPFEPWFESRLRARLERGTVTITADFEADAPVVSDIVDAARFAAVAAHLTELARAAGLAAGPSVADVLAVPGVLRSSGAARTAGSGGRTSRDPAPDCAAVFDRALDELVATREAEGRATVAGMRADLELLRTARAAVLADIPRIRDAYRDRLLERVREFLADRAPALAPPDVVREVALFAEKTDVGEELHRLETHLDAVDARLADGSGSVGRALDFLLQEVLREVNTLGSKTPDAAVAHHVVAMKGAVERLKEQAANLE